MKVSTERSAHFNRAKTAKGVLNWPKFMSCNNDFSRKIFMLLNKEKKDENNTCCKML